MRTDAIPFAVGTLGYGLVCLAFGDFGLQWQPVPDWVPGRTALAYANGVLLATGGALLLWPRTSLWAARFLAGYILLWVLLLKVPGVIANPTSMLPWLGFGEIFSLAVGAATLALLLDREPREKEIGIARYAYGICPIIFGLSHFVYVDFTAAMVPGWIPAPLFWAWASGAGHFAAGLAILSGILARLATMLLAAMMGSFVLLLCIPAMVADPASHIAWTMVFISAMLAGAAWAIQAGLAQREAAIATD